MDCNTPVTWENIIRPAIRIIEDGCTAIAVDTSGSTDGVYDCDGAPLLTRAAMAIPDGLVKMSISSAGIVEPHDCSDLPLASIETLLGHVLVPGSTPNTSFFIGHEDPLFDDACDEDCDRTVSLDELFRRTLVRTQVPTEWAVQVFYSSASAITCDHTDVPTSELLRSAFFPVGNGTYAIRVVQEA